MTAGVFLSFEGVEGCGKTTQVKLVAQRLHDAGLNFIATKEPGGTPLADRIRAILLDPQEEGMDAMTELFLYAASRRQHVVEVIQPALDAGAVVLTDRYTDASLAYQGFGRTLDFDRIQTLNDWATGGIYPDLTLVFDLPEDIGLARARARNSESAHLQTESRLEGEDLKFHRRVREGYLTLAKANPKRYEIVDANGTAEEVFARTIEVLARRVPRLHAALSPKP